MLDGQKSVGVLGTPSGVGPLLSKQEETSSNPMQQVLMGCLHSHTLSSGFVPFELMSVLGSTRLRLQRFQPMNHTL